MNNQKDLVLSRIRSQIREIDPSAHIILYGSRARGDEKSDSDWDILILVNSEVDLKSEQVFRHKLFDVELELGESFSTFVYNEHEWKSKYWMTPLYKNISKEGIAI